MKNADIIKGNAIDLMEKGIIKSVGTAETADGSTVEVPEEIATFQSWKRRGYMVMKGQHAVAKFKIWKPCKKKSDSDDEEPTLYLVDANFFSASQVERMAQRAPP